MGKDGTGNDEFKHSSAEDIGMGEQWRNHKMIG